MCSLIRYERDEGERPRRPIPYSREPYHLTPSEVELQLVCPEKSPYPAATVELLLALSGMNSAFVLQIVAADERVEVGIRCASRQAAEIERIIRGVLLEGEVAESRLADAPEGSLHLVAALGPSDRADWVPQRDASSLGQAEPLAAILEALGELASGEKLIFRLKVWPAELARRVQAWKGITKPAPPQNLVGVVAYVMGRGDRIPLFEPRLHRKLEDRLSEKAFEVVGTIDLVGHEMSRLISRARYLTSVFDAQFDGGWGSFSLEEWRWRARPANSLVRWQEGEPSLYLTAGELACLWHLPSNRLRIPGIARLKRPVVPLPLELKRASGLQLGTHQERGQRVPIYLSRRDLEAGHLIIIGRTGVGKSTLGHQLIRQGMLAPNRLGIGLIDPNHDQARDVLLQSIPPGREEDVVLVDVVDTEFPVGIPFFWSPAGVSKETVVQNTFAALKLIFREHWSPTRMEDAIFAITATLCNLPGSTLLDVPRLLSDPIFRRSAIARLSDPVALGFWADFETLSESGKREVARPILHRTRGLTRSPAVRNLVCQTRGIDFEDVLNQRRILLVNLAGAEVQGEADLLGELMIAHLHLAALARLSRPREERVPFYLAVDESQRFQGASLPILLSEGRKLGLSLILSTQFLDGWSETLADSVLGNVGTLIAFRCGPKDSRRLAASLRPFTPEQLEDLDRYEAIVKMQSGGATMPAFDIQTLPVESPPNEQALERIRRRSRERYARPRAEVEAELQAKVGQPSIFRETFDVDEE